MIYARLFDGGTDLRKLPASVPGLDTAWWVGSGWEQSIFDWGNRTAQLNALMASLDPLTVRTWPEQMPRKMWVDATNRYHWNSLDGLRFNLHHVDRITEQYPEMPAGDPEWRDDLSELLQPEDGRIHRELAWREIRERAEDPNEWYRLPTLNESGGTKLKEPLALRAQGPRGALALELPDQSLFAPFDLSHPERYRVFDNAGNEIDQSAMYLYPRSTSNLYLRPRWWKYYVTVYAIFWYISVFELFALRYVFTKAWYDRPPIYPIRHNIMESTPASTDPAVLWQFEHSNAAAELTREIFDAQHFGLCEVVVFGFIELVQMWIERAAPRRSEAVLGIGRVDQATGRESPVWVRARSNQDSLYPTTDIAFFQEVPWYILPGSNTGVA